MRKKIVFLFIISFWAIGLINAENPVVSVKQNKKPSIEKIKDIVIYKDSMFYVAFPSVTKNAEGEYIVAFRRAPDRKATMGYKGRYHSDPNSYLVMLRSKDGENWGTEPDLLFAHPQGGSQDPCLLTLRDGTMLCSSYCWTFILQEAYAKLKQPVKIAIDGGVFLGGYMVRSEDNGKTWKGPYYPPSLTEYNNVLGQPLPAANRGAFCEGKSGRIFWSVNKARVGKPSQNYLLYSDDKGISWEKSCMVASDDKVTFNETSIYETPKGDLVAFLRTANNDDHPCIARSTDGGKSFSQWEEMGFQGHPLHALRLSDNRSYWYMATGMNHMASVQKY